MQISGFRLIRTADSAEVERWEQVPARVEYSESGSVVVRVDGAVVGWSDGRFRIEATSWTVADPPPVVVVQWSVLVSRFTDVEWAGVQKAVNSQVTAGNGFIARWVALATVNGVDVTDTKTLNIKAQLVTAAILTQARADAIFVAP